MTTTMRGRSPLAAPALVTNAALGHAPALDAGRPPDDQMYALPGAGLLRALDLGHHALVADLVTARANVSFGAAVAAHREAPALESLLATAAELDPDVCERYRRGAAMLVDAAGAAAITPSAVEAADRLLARGAAAGTASGEIWFQLGFDRLFELPRLVAAGDARRPAWRRAGLEAPARAARLPDAPPWRANLVAKLLAEGRDPARAVSYLDEVYAETRDPAARAQMRRQLSALAGSAAEKRASGP
jgi:hypothetical protein